MKYSEPGNMTSETAEKVLMGVADSIIKGNEPTIPFEINNAGVQRQEVEFWASAVDAFLQNYLATDVSTKEGIAARGIACSQLVIFGQLMANHFMIGFDAAAYALQGNRDDVLALADAADAASDAIKNRVQIHTAEVYQAADKTLS